MKRYRVIYEIFDDSGNRMPNQKVYVEAGNKRLACTRAMAKICEDRSLVGLYKKITKIEEAE